MGKNRGVHGKIEENPPSIEVLEENKSSINGELHYQWRLLWESPLSIGIEMDKMVIQLIKDCLMMKSGDLSTEDGCYK